MIGILLINVGTPDSPHSRDVGRYLTEFLMDENVIDLPFLLRYPLVNWFIVPGRKHRSAKNYAKIWTPLGSPLLLHTQALAQKLQAKSEACVQYAMLVGSPSIKTAFEEFEKKGIKYVKVLPLFPQYADATTGAAIKAVEKTVDLIGNRGKGAWSPRFELDFIPEFFAHEKFAAVFAAHITKHLKDLKPDFYLFSFHGLPEKQILKADPRRCYRTQCFKTARLIAAKLALKPDQYEIAFQSRLGLAEWIKPYTKDVFKSLPKRGVKNLCVISPSFVADCLETLEEIGLRAKEEFMQSGTFHLIPALNAEDSWVDFVYFITL